MISGGNDMTRILAVDDDERILKLIRNALAKEANDVARSEERREGKECARTCR